MRWLANIGASAPCEVIDWLAMFAHACFLATDPQFDINWACKFVDQELPTRAKFVYDKRAEKAQQEKADKPGKGQKRNHDGAPVQQVQQVALSASLMIACLHLYCRES